MPWAVSQVDQHIKGLDSKQKGKWASIANGVLKSCRASGMSEDKCAAKAVRIANSKFSSSARFNPVLPQSYKINLNFGSPTLGRPASAIADTGTADDENDGYDPDDDGDIDTVSDVDDSGDVESSVGNLLWLTPDMQERLTASVDECIEKGGSQEECMNVLMDKMKRGLNFGYRVKKMMESCPDCQAMMDECKSKGMSEDECKKVVMDKMKKDMAKREYAELRDLPEMEIFRAGTHNGDAFSEADLEEMAANFKALKDDLRPKLKITHAEDSNQESLAGLASYGDVMDVFVKTDAEGKKRLFAKLSRVPLEVYDWIKEGRFAERSIELYPEFKLGTKDDSPTYKNVLKSIALLGHQMPAVTGMAPIKLEECLECQGTSCFREKITEQKTEDYSQRFLMLEKTLEFAQKTIAA